MSSDFSFFTEINQGKNAFLNDEVPCTEACFNRINKAKFFSRLVFEDL